MNVALTRRLVRRALRAALLDIYFLSIVSFTILFFGHPFIGAVCLALSMWFTWRRHLIRMARINN